MHSALRLEDLPMRVCRAKEIALGSRNGSLGLPSKMPGYAFGLSAFACVRGQLLAADPESICHHCYARSNFYRTKHEVLIAHERRMHGVRHPEWATAMTTLILRYVEEAEPYFRWHDSGDLIDVRHLANLVEVCRRTPWVRHWLPTHEPYIVRDFLAHEAQEGGAGLPPNLCLRISADYVGVPPAAIPGLEGLPTSTAHRGFGRDRIVRVSDDPGDSIECKAYLRRKLRRRNTAGLCGTCRACWEPHVRNVSYPLHAEKSAQLELFER